MGSETMRKFFDPSYTSCTSWIAHIASTKFGMDVAPLAELIYWADIVDGAKYESATSAVEMGDAAMKLTMVIESAPESAYVQRIIPLLTEKMTLNEQFLAQPFIQERLEPLMVTHRASIELIRERSHCERGVITFDITDQPTEGYNKFIPYYLHPEGTYNVGFVAIEFPEQGFGRVRIPGRRSRPSELANLAAICERYGGGGHARVGAIGFRWRRKMRREWLPRRL